MLLAYLNPIPPGAWLLERVDAVVERFVALFDEHRSGGLASLPDCNLDTGQPTMECGAAAVRRELPEAVEIA